MPIYILGQTDIASPVYARLAAGATPKTFAAGDTPGTGDVLVIDANTSSPDDVKLGFPAIDAGAALLVLDGGDDFKEALAAHIGFRSHGASRGYKVSRTNDGGAVRFHISEVGDSTAPASLYSASGTANTEQGTRQVDADGAVYENQEQTQTMTEEDLAFFVASLAPAASLEAATTPPPAGLVKYTWIYSKSHSFTASGNQSDSGIGPPPSKTISTNLTYTFEGALNNSVQSGAFQYLGVQENGIFQNNGMSSTSDTDFGWVLGSISPSFAAPSAFNWYSSSPPNTNDVTQVTTGSSVTVGFNASNTGGGGNASYTYSNSTTNNISDWYVTQQTSSSWTYGQNTPYDGNTTSGSTVADCINWYSGHVNTSSFPTISTSSLQFAVNEVWKTNSVITSAQTFTISNQMRVDYIMINTFLGLGTKWATWIYTSTPSDTFTIDMSVLNT